MLLPGPRDPRVADPDMTLLPAPSDTELLRLAEERQAKRRGVALVERSLAVLTLPITIVLPWSALCSDNIRHTIGGGPRPQLVLEARYRQAKQKTATIARAVVGDVRAVAFPLALHARVYVPDNRVHDCGNFRKGITDALASIIYANDKQLYRETWERAGVDVDAPRAEILISDMGLR